MLRVPCEWHLPRMDLWTLGLPRREPLLLSRDLSTFVGLTPTFSRSSRLILHVGKSKAGRVERIDGCKAAGAKKSKRNALSRLETLSEAGPFLHIGKIDHGLSSSCQAAEEEYTWLPHPFQAAKHTRMQDICFLWTRLDSPCDAIIRNKTAKDVTGITGPSCSEAHMSQAANIRPMRLSEGHMAERVLQGVWQAVQDVL